MTKHKNTYKKTISLYKNYGSFIKISHTIFALPFAIIGLSIGLKANQIINPIQVSICVVLCMFFARNSAMGFNRLIDKNIDSENPRTQNRELPKGILNNKEAILFIALNSLLFITTTWFINTKVFLLSPIALFTVLFYSYTKRFTWLCHFFLGLGLSLAPIGAYLSVTNHWNVIAILISIAVMFWSAGFDIIYALQDINFDTKHNLHSIPQKFGIIKALYISRISHTITAIILITIAFLYTFSYLYIIGASIFIFLLLYQHILIKRDNFSKINLAFFTLNGIASIVFAIFVVGDIYLLQ